MRITHAESFPLTLEGELQIEGPKGLVDAYQVKIEVDNDFPVCPPIVFETAQRLPRDIDRHVYSDGRVCLEVWPVWLAQHSNPTVSDVLNGPVRNFFLSQTFFEVFGKWPFGEFSHGNQGKREAIRDAVRAKSTEDKDLLWRIYGLVEPPRRQNICPCGSRKLFRKCHKAELQDISKGLSSEGIWQITDLYLELLKQNEKVT